MKKDIIAGLILTVTFLAPQVGAKTAAEFRDEWKSLGFGLYIHFGIKTYADPRADPEELIKPAEFNPTKLEARQWALVAKGAGAKYVVLTVKHEYGFCLWNSSGYKYDLGSSPVRKLDIVGEFIDACKAEGLKAGVHYSIGDLFNEGVMRKKGPTSQPYFNTIKEQTEELHKNFPGISIHLFDWGMRLSPDQRQELHELIEKLNPNCLVWSGGKPAGLPPGTFIPRQGYGTIVQNKTWMWEPGCKLTPANLLYQKYLKANSGGSNFIVSVGPDRTGRIPDDQLIVLEELKSMMNGHDARGPASANRSDSGKEQLKKLKSLYDQELISKEIYEMKQKELLDSFLSSSDAPAELEKPTGPVDLRNGLVLYFSFNEKTGSKIVDASGHDNHGRVRGAKWTKEGRMGGAYRFDQKRRVQGILVEDSDSLDCRAVTLVAWIKVDEAGEGWPRIVDKDWKEGYDLALAGVQPNGGRKNMLGKALMEFSEKRSIMSKNSVCDGDWHHLVASYGNGKAFIYVDGKLNSEKNIPNRNPVMVNDFDLMIGNCHPGHTKPESEKNAFGGLIDELLIYNRVLNPGEVFELYNKAK